MSDSKRITPAKIGQTTKSNNNKKGNNKSKFLIITGGALIVVVVLTLVIFNLTNGTETSSDVNGNVAKTSSNLPSIVINKSEITSTAKFYPVTIDGTKMEVLAVKAPDGTIRTAMNTCQVCYDSGRGYYKQEGDELICQNCKNRFKLSQVEKIKGGCNPVPILEEDKTDDGTSITITGSYLEQNKELFSNWKKS